MQVDVSVHNGGIIQNSIVLIILSLRQSSLLRCCMLNGMNGDLEVRS